jgi:beta-lactamase class A
VQRRTTPDHSAPGKFAPQRQTLWLTAAFAIAVLVADSMTLLLHAGRSADHGSAARTSALRHSATLGPASQTPQPTPSSSPRPTAASHKSTHRNPLGSAAKAYLSTRAGSVLAAVYDERTNRLWTLGQASPQNEASIVKVDILETLLAQHHVRGTELSASDVTLAQEMIEDSDNNAATALWNEVGGARAISAYNRSVGLTDTTLSGCVTCPGFPWPGWGLSTTTAADQIALLRELLQPSAQLTGGQQAFALGLMKHVTPSQRWGVAAGLPLTATVALKDGWLPLTSGGDDWQVNSIGWIFGGRGNYLIAVLTTGNPSEQYGIDTISELSAIVWRHMR